MTITGSGFDDTDQILLNGDMLSNVTFVSATELEVILPVRPLGSYSLNVLVDDNGFAGRDVSTDIDYILRVDNVFPRQASRMGGQRVTITGAGFHEDLTIVNVGETNCVVDSVTNTQVRFTH